MGKAWRTPSLVALALLLTLLAAAMEHSLAAAAEEETAAPTTADADAPAADEDTTGGDNAADADAPAADEDTTGGDDGAPAPTPEPATEEPSPGHKSIGAKAKAGWHKMVAGISQGKDKLECKVLRQCPASDAPSAA